MQERIKAFRDIAALIRTRAQEREGQAHAALMSVSVDLERHADGMAADEQAHALPGNEREQRARDLYERMAKRKGCTEPLTWAQMHHDGREHYKTIVDVIGEIERERHPLRVLTMVADGSQSVRTVPDAWQPLTEAEALRWVGRRRLGSRDTTWGAIADALLAANRGDIPPEVRPSDPLALDPEDGTLCGGCRAPRNAIHSPLCPVRSGEKVERVSIDHGKDEGTALAYGTWSDEWDALRAASKPEMPATTGKPWAPKPGDRVRTVDPLTRCDSYNVNANNARRPGVGGAIKRVFGSGLSNVWIVSHDDDGSEAPYDADELRPEPAKVGTSYPTPKPWDGPRRYRSDDRDMPGHDLDLMIRPPDGNGDWYVSVLPHGARGGPAVRITTSGTPDGQHGVCVAVARLYEAMLPNAKGGA